MLGNPGLIEKKWVKDNERVGKIHDIYIGTASEISGRLKGTLRAKLKEDPNFRNHRFYICANGCDVIIEYDRFETDEEHIKRLAEMIISGQIEVEPQLFLNSFIGVHGE
jgi:hypothetical protein